MSTKTTYIKDDDVRNLIRNSYKVFFYTDNKTRIDLRVDDDDNTIFLRSFSYGNHYPIDHFSNNVLVKNEKNIIWLSYQDDNNITHLIPHYNCIPLFDATVDTDGPYKQNDDDEFTVWRGFLVLLAIGVIFSLLIGIACSCKCTVRTTKLSSRECLFAAACVMKEANGECLPSDCNCPQSDCKCFTNELESMLP